MNKLYRHILCILLLLIALCFCACNSKTIPAEISEFKNNYENSDKYLDELAKIADSCSKNYARNPVFLEKKSQIFFQKGRNEHKKSEYVNATESFIKAYYTQKDLLALKKATDNDDLHYLGQILENVGDVYSDVNSLKPASYFYDQALSEFELAGLHHEVIDILLKIGDLYLQNHISNIALLNYEIAEGKKNLTEQQSDMIQIKKGIALYDIFDINSADSLYRRISTKSLHFIELQYFTACHFYYNNKFDESLPYLLKCFEEGDVKMKVNAAEMLASVYFSLNEHDKELYYAQYQAKAQSAEARLTPVKMELDTIYDSFVEANNPENTNKSRGYSSLIWILVAIILLLIVGIVILHSYVTSNKKAPVIRSFEDDYKAFTSTKIYKEIKSSLDGKEILTKTVGDYPRLGLTKVKIVSLTTKFNESFPNLTHSLSKRYPELTSSDFRFIIFSLMGFSDIEIAVLLKQTYGAANKRSNRIKDIFHTEEDLEHFVPNFLRKIKY